ncbi:NAD-dependent epimerase/dehydratase family protein [Anaerophaga thermohalophila]|uniref:NAD-dependent epimerase/dehydratase family protein n=1 Tax=Anaerophaga thermohalophila TaxID=177400 RepID=UPI000237CDFB|nr:NAD-dependent epimerase/dehydratase family protein [Anaerophaga thermohalophila]
MNVLVLGGTGAMGIHLVKLLTINEINTFVTTRKKIKSGKNLTYIQGNAKESSFVKKLLQERWDAIIDFMIYKTNEFEERASLLLNATNQYIFLSSARVYANSENPINEDSNRLLDVSEDTNFLATDEYSLSKARQENILMNSGLNNWTIIRPYITYSENRFQLGVLEKEEWLYRALKRRTIVFSKDMISKQTTLTYGGDVSKGIFALIGNNNALGKKFHITANDSHTWGEILQTYTTILEKTLGFRPKVLLQNMNKFAEIHPAKYQIEYDRLYDRQFENSKINKFVNTKSFLTIGDGLEKCLNVFLQNPNFKNINWKLEALKDRQTKERTPLNEIEELKQKNKYFLYRYFPVEIINKLKIKRK